MTYAYTTATQRRLVLGDPAAAARLCLPIPPEVYDAVGALADRDEAYLLWILGEFVEHLVAPVAEQAAASAAGPDAESV